MEYKSNDVCHECEISASIPWQLDTNRVYVYKTALILMTLALNSAELEIKQLQTQLDDVNENMGRVEERCAKLREEIEAAKHDLSMFSERIVELDADNAKLCMRVASLESALEGMHLIREMDLAENAKLRELVKEAVDAASLKDMRDWRYGKRLAFLREARELGIEVPE